MAARETENQNRKGYKMRSRLQNFLLFPCLIFGFTPRSSAEAQPRIFAEGVISTGDHESHPAFSPDGRMLMFVKMAPDFSKWTLFVSYDGKSGWSEPEIAPFSGQYWDADPFFTKDGKTLYFFSSSRNKHAAPFAGPERTGEMRQRIRSAGNGLLDIYQVDFSALRKALESQPSR